MNIMFFVSYALLSLDTLLTLLDKGFFRLIKRTPTRWRGEFGLGWRKWSLSF